MMQWSLEVGSKRPRFTSRHLARADKFVLQATFAALENFLTSLTSATLQQMRHYITELLEDHRFHGHLDDAGKEPDRPEAICANIDKTNVFVKLTIVRAFRPDCMIWRRE